MKFTIQSKQLYNKLQYCGKVINNKNTLPVLECFKLGVRGQTLHIASADTETRITTKVDIESVEGEGEIAIPAKTLLDALKELSDQPLTFEVNEDNLEVFINYHNGKYNFIGQSANEYPIPKPLGKEYKKLSIEPVDLLNGINGTAFAIANDELRPVMCGIYFDIKQDNVTFVASDGHKLAKLTSTNVKSEEESSFILPNKPVQLLKAILPKAENRIDIQFDFNNAIFKIDEYTITARFAEGRYPNYNSVIPQNNANKAVLDRLQLLSIVKRVSVYANKNSNLIKLDFKDNELIVSSQDIDFSTSAQEQTQIEYNGSPIEIGFKATFLIELLESINSEEIELSMSDPSRAALIKPTINKERWDLTGLLMPMMLSN